MEQNKQKNSKRRLNSLILLVAFTAIMLIVSTYAWFSTQKTVSISNLTGTVKVAEGLAISLDAEKWSQEIDFSQYTPDQLKKTYDTSTETNVVPTELIPASTDGKGAINATTGDSGAKVVEMPFYRGIATQENLKWKLSGVSQAEGIGSTKPSSDVQFNGYYAIDLFLRNSGLKEGETEGTTKETLQLAQGSKVAVITDGDDSTGLQNTPRVAFALYDGSAGVIADKTTVLTGTTGATKGITDVAIWEPNSNAHVANTVTNFNNITWKDGEAAKYLATPAGGKFTATEKIPTYALSKDSIGKTYDDLYNWNGTTNAGLVKQIALQTDSSETGTAAATNLISVNTVDTAIAPVSPSGEKTEFQILKNQTIRLRMYVWLEGQDPDCVNYASHGGGIELDFGLCKGEETTVPGVGP